MQYPNKFKVGDLAMALTDITFTDGTEHVLNHCYNVTEDNVSYFNVRHKDYMNVTPAEESTLPSMDPKAIGLLRSAFRGNEMASIYDPLKGSKINIVKLVYALFDFSGLLKAKTWCEEYIFND